MTLSRKKELFLTSPNWIQIVTHLLICARVCVPCMCTRNATLLSFIDFISLSARLPIYLYSSTQERHLVYMQSSENTIMHPAEGNEPSKPCWCLQIFHMLLCLHPPADFLGIVTCFHITTELRSSSLLAVALGWSGLEPGWIHVSEGCSPLPLQACQPGLPEAP